jgi:hypothetical protein
VVVVIVLVLVVLVAGKKKPARSRFQTERSLCCCLRFAGFLRHLAFDPEYKGGAFLRNVDELVLDYTALGPTLYYSLQLTLLERQIQ